jgi:hypothetical protein
MDHRRYVNFELDSTVKQDTWIHMWGAFAKFWKATISFMSVVRLFACLSVCMEQLGSH